MHLFTLGAECAHPHTSITESRLETLLQLIDTEKAALYHIPHVLSSSSSPADILVIARVLIEGFCRCCNADADAFASTLVCSVCGHVAASTLADLGQNRWPRPATVCSKPSVFDDFCLKFLRVRLPKNGRRYLVRRGVVPERIYSNPSPRMPRT